MQTKLTLRLDQSLIHNVKDYAKQHEKSVSQLVADYFQILTQQTKDTEIPPITQSLVGVLNNSHIDKQNYKEYLEEKYL